MKAISNRVAVTAACIALTIQAAVVIPTVVAVWWFAGGSGEEAAEDLLLRNVAVDTAEGRSLVGKIGRSREGWHWFHPETERQSPYAFAEARSAARGLVSMSRYSHSGGSTRILSVRPVTVSGEPVGWVEEWAAPKRRARMAVRRAPERGSVRGLCKRGSRGVGAGEHRAAQRRTGLRGTAESDRGRGRFAARLTGRPLAPIKSSL